MTPSLDSEWAKHHNAMLMKSPGRMFGPEHPLSYCHYLQYRDNAYIHRERPWSYIPESDAMWVSHLEEIEKKHLSPEDTSDASLTPVDFTPKYTTPMPTPSDDSGERETGPTPEPTNQMDEYQQWTREMSVYLHQVPSRFHSVTEYEWTAFVGEVGEAANIHKKWLTGKITDRSEYHEKMKDELGDVIFYYMRLLDRYNLSMEDVVSHNIDKLSKRYGKVGK